MDDRLHEIPVSLTLSTCITKGTRSRVFTWHDTAPSANGRVILVASIASHALYMVSVCVVQGLDKWSHKGPISLRLSACVHLRKIHTTTAFRYFRWVGIDGMGGAHTQVPSADVQISIRICM